MDTRPDDPNPLISLFRRCVVRVDDATGRFLGTGFFVAPGAVLTCAHVVYGSDELAVSWEGAVRAAAVVGAEPPLESVADAGTYPMPDLALLAVDVEGGWAGHPCARLGSVPALGEALYIAGHTVEHARGEVALTGAGAELESAITELSITFFKLRRGQILPGFSGAPLLHQRTGDVCGIIDSTRDRRSDLGGFAVPAAVATAAFPLLGAANTEFHAADHRWRDAVEAERIVAATRRRSRPRLPLLPPTVTLDWSVDISPAAALRPRHAVVPYVGRERLLQGIEGWCEAGGDDPAPLGVWFVTGGGGLGKTRLAVEACLQAQRRGWTAGLLSSDLPDAKLEELAAWPGRLLIVLDYAETRPAVLRRLVEELAAQAPRPPVRVLLLVRRRATKADLLETFNDEHEEELAGLLRRAELSVLEDAETEVDRLVLFDRGVAEFCSLLGRPGRSLGRPQLRAPHFARPLYVLVAALLLANDSDVDVDAQSERDLLRLLLIQHEANYWSRSAVREALPLDRHDQRVAVALATLMTAADEREALGVVGLVPDLGRDPSRHIAVARWLAGQYGGVGPGTLTLGPLEPDRLGEVLVADVLAERPRLLGQAMDRAAPDQLIRLLNVTARVALEDGRVRDQLRYALDERLSDLLARPVARDDALPAALMTAIEVSRPLEGAREAADRLPDQPPFWLMPIAMRVATLATDGLRAHAASDPARRAQLAWSLHRLGFRLMAAGRRAEALPPATEAVDLYRELAGADSGFLPDLAMSLSTLSTRLGAAGERVRALTAASEAVDILRALSRMEEQVGQLSAAGVGEEAEILRDLSLVGIGAFSASLAGALTNLSTYLGALGRRADGLSAAAEAVDLFRKLASVDPANFRPRLGISLNNLGNRLSEAGRRAEALSIAAEAVGVYRELARDDRGGFLPALSLALNNLAACLSESGRVGDAVSTAEESVALRRELAEADRGAFLPDLAMSLTTLAACLNGVGRNAECLSVATEAVQLRRELADANPGAFLEDLAMSLNNLAAFSRAAGRRPEALSAGAEAVGLYRQLARVEPGAFLPRLATALGNLANRLGDGGQRSEALSTATEAAGLYRDLAATDRSAFLPALASALSNLSNHQGHTGRAADALSTAREAAELRRELARSDPGAFLPDLAMSLSNLAVTLGAAGEHSEALFAAVEAVALRRQLAETDPGAFLADLATSLHSLAISLNAAGRPAEGLAAAEEAVGLFWELATADPGALLPDLASALNNLATFLGDAGRHAEAEEGLAASLAQFGDSPLGEGHVRFVRGRWLSRYLRLAEAGEDLAAAISAFDDAGDMVWRGKARSTLRALREYDPAPIDAAWHKVHGAIPVWLALPTPDQDWNALVEAWVNVADWEASKAHLVEHADTLLSDRAEAALEHLIDSNPVLLVLAEHLRLLRAARASGVDVAYEAQEKDRLFAQLTAILVEWMSAPSWDLSRANAAGHEGVLLTRVASGLLDAMVNRHPRVAALRLHQGLLAVAVARGFDAAYALLGPAARVAALAAEEGGEPTDRLLALARIDSGSVRDSAEAHFRLAMVALRRGEADEAAAAMADCADHSAPFERADFARRLDALAATQPEFAPLVPGLALLLER